MKSIRPLRVLVVAAIMAAALVLIGHAFRSKQGSREGLEAARKLEKIAEHRFKNARGLSPCGGGEWQLVESARSRSIAIGESKANLIIVVAPTFSEIELVTIGPDYIRAYRFPGQTGFSPPSGDWFEPRPRKISDVSLTFFEQAAISAPLRRHVTYAMTAREYGYDGVSYYFGSGEDGCAFAWMPRGDGPGGLIADMIEEASSQSPSKVKLIELAKEIDSADLAR